MYYCLVAIDAALTLLSSNLRNCSCLILLNEKRNICCGDVQLVTQHSEPNDADVAPPSVWEVVDQALVGPSVRQLGVVDEDGGTCTWHGCHEAHTTIEVVGEAEHLAALVNDHLDWDVRR